MLHEHIKTDNRIIFTDVMLGFSSKVNTLHVECIM